MIKSKELLQLIKDTTMKLAGFEAQMAFKIYTDAEVKISQRTVGGKVEMIGADGELSPVEDGDYEMQDGFKFTVKDGQISAIEGQEEKPADEAPAEEEVKAKEDASVEGTPAEEATETPEEETTEDSEEDQTVQALTDKVAALEQVIAAMQQAIEELKGSTAVAASKEDVNAFALQVQSMNEVVVKLANMPAEFSKTNSNPIVKDAGDKKKMELGAIIADVMKK